MAAEQRSDMKLMSGGTVILLLLIGLGAVVAFIRMTAGLGATTNLSDSYPWGLWISLDVMVGVALAAGGFTMTAAVYILNLEKYKPIVRPAVLTAFIGYLMVCLGLFLDIGKPWSLWHPLVMWQPTSMLFEVAWCVILYTTVLFFEFSPSLFAGWGMEGAAKAMRSKVIVLPLVIAGITLSYGHQSSLGGLFLLSESKLSGLWWTPMINNMFFLSAIAAGLAMVSFETIVSHRVFKMKQNMSLLSGLARGTAIALMVYLVARVVDLLVRGNLGLIFTGGTASLLFVIEVAGGVVLPMVLLFSKGIRQSESGMLWSQVLVLAGIVLNRFNVIFLTQSGPGAGYFPNWKEFVVTVGIISLAVFLYRWAVVSLPVLSHTEAEQS